VLLWVSLSVAFGFLLWALRGQERGLEFFTAYVHRVRAQRRQPVRLPPVVPVLPDRAGAAAPAPLLGVLGAFVMRGVLILGGAALDPRVRVAALSVRCLPALDRVQAAPRQGGRAGDRPRPEPGAQGRATGAPGGGLGARRPLRRQQLLGEIQVTSLFLVLLCVETTDLMFALDSIPAVLGISRDPFVLYSSNITAVLGLRSLFFVLSSLLAKLRYLKPALALVLGFVGLKMIFEKWIGSRSGCR
jgi:tellurite resistance protein TerC